MAPRRFYVNERGHYGIHHNRGWFLWKVLGPQDYGRCHINDKCCYEKNYSISTIIIKGITSKRMAVTEGIDMEGVT